MYSISHHGLLDFRDQVVRKMMVSHRGSVLRLLMWQWRSTLAFLVVGALAPIAHEVFGWTHVTMPLPPLTVLGATLAIFVSFRTNSAYARWWEGRKLWGRLINASRLFATQVSAYLPAGQDGPSALQRRLVMRQAAYVHALRVSLRGQAPREDGELTRTIGPDARLIGASNLAHALVDVHLAELAREADAGRLDERRLQSLDRTVTELLAVQGGCERIKKTPLPPGYAFVAQRLVMCFALLFPLALVEELGWWVVPVNLLVCLGFHLINEVGRVLEDPFTIYWNALPLSAMSVMIEVNMRERLGDADLPVVPQVDRRGILM